MDAPGQSGKRVANRYVLESLIGTGAFGHVYSAKDEMLGRTVALKVMGTAVIGGMLTATCIAIFIIPATFYLVEKLAHRKDKDGHEPPKKPGLAEREVRHE